ncbi:MAG: glycosyltransferase [Candidatus Falkowbacteria bacterium]|nr:glycosyltransferase [Candidatus Falkowbacteria bacterium]
MNIFFINTTDIKGGAATIAYGLKQGIKKNGFNSKMFVREKISKDSDVIVGRVNGWQIFLSRLFSTDMDFLNSNKFMRQYFFKEADIVHCHNLHGRFFNLSNLKRISSVKPMVWTLHDMWAITPHCAHSLDKDPVGGFYNCLSINTPPKILWHNEFYLKWKKKKTYKESNLEIVVPSKWLLEKVRKSVLGNKNISLIYNGVDEEIFKQKNKFELRNKLGLPRDKKIVLFVADGGSNNFWKGWKYAVQVIEHFKKDQSVLFLCIGGVSNNTFENVEYIDYVCDQHVLAGYYSASDIFLFTSVAENFPLVILEAMSCGVPVVSFDVGGVSEALIHKENGYIAKYQDVGDLIFGVESILKLSDRELIDISNRSVIRVKKNFSLDSMIDNYCILYKKLLNDKS